MPLQNVIIIMLYCSNAINYCIIELYYYSSVLLLCSDTIVLYCKSTVHQCIAELLKLSTIIVLYYYSALLSDAMNYYIIVLQHQRPLTLLCSNIMCLYYESFPCQHIEFYYYSPLMLLFSNTIVLHHKSIPCQRIVLYYYSRILLLSSNAI